MRNEGKILFEKNYLVESFSMFICAIALGVLWTILRLRMLLFYIPIPLASNIMVSAILIGFLFILICQAMFSSFIMLTPFRIYKNGISLPKPFFYYICQKKDVFLPLNHIKRMSCGYPFFTPSLILYKILIETKDGRVIEVPLLLSEKQSVKTINKMKEIFNILSIEFMEYPYFKEKEN
ncbi:MAG: hypothetical protein KKB04_00865, partial [Candidatus Thermoplasmatota archaeon]|nr:hypothetical protein [Candidatus Thermoplasmatota archaeon]